MKTWILLVSGFLAPFALGAACCGTSSAVPALLSGPDRVQVTLGLAYGAVVGDADPTGDTTERSPGDQESAQNLLISAATLLSDRWQGGISVPINRRSRDRNGSFAEHTGLGDIALNIAFEALPNWSYSKWRPNGTVFTTLTLPTGSSIYDSTQLYSVDSHGKGFLRLGLGFLLTKQWGSWDVSLVGEGHRSFGRDLPPNMVPLSPGWGYSAQIGLGFSPMNRLRLGVSAGPQVEQGVVVGGPAPLSPEAERVWNSTLEANFFFNTEWTASLSYQDQSWLGASQNTGVRRVAAVRLQHKWPR